MEYQAIDEGKEYKVYPTRFLVSGLFGLIQMMTSVLMNTLNPIASELSIIYDY
jgi:FLVCR family feline leukemia virus subgroup C receptor-related protein